MMMFLPQRSIMVLSISNIIIEKKYEQTFKVIHRGYDQYHCILYGMSLGRCVMKIGMFS